MQRYLKIQLLLPVLLAVIIGGCSKPAQPVFDNPFDPADPDYASPQVEIISGPAEGTTINTDSVAFAWQGKGSASSFSFCLGNGAWQETGDKNWAFANVYEGQQTFTIRAKNDLGNYGPIVTRNFTVNMVTGPALMIYPKTITMAVNATAVVYCMLEDAATPVSFAHLVLNYDPAYISIAGVNADSTIWTVNGGSLVGPFNNSDSLTGVLDYSIGVAGGSPSGVSGSGRMLRVTIKAKAAGSAGLNYNVSASLRDTLNSDILLNSRVGCAITAQ